MRVRMRYGRGELEVEVPDQNIVGPLRMKRAKPLSAPVETIEAALLSPIASPPLSEIARGRSSACVVISDITRPVPNKLILPPILRTLEKSGIPREEIVILIATGIHRPNEGDELQEMVGAELMSGYRFINHYSQRPETLLDLGKTDRGTPVLLNRVYCESDLKISTSLIEPHLMAGYSGGRKAICPGISSLETMKVMHGPHILEHERATTGVLEGNPFHEEATEIARMAGVDFSLNVALNDSRELVGVFAGELVAAHLAGVKFVEQFVRVELDQPVDIVLTSSAGYPLDTTFYQAIKGLVGALDIIKQGGTMILVSECSEQLGSPEFTDLILNTEDLKQFVQDLYDPAHFTVDQWQLEEMAKVARKAEICCYSEGIPWEDLKRIFVHPLRTPEEGIRYALAKHGKNARIAVIPEGPYLLPVLADPSRRET